MKVLPGIPLVITYSIAGVGTAWEQGWLNVPECMNVCTAVEQTDYYNYRHHCMSFVLDG